MLYVRFPLSLRHVEDLLHERGIDFSHETVRFWWNRFGPLLAGDIKKKRINQMRACSNWLWHQDEVFFKINAESHDLWRAVDHGGEVLESNLYCIGNPRTNWMIKTAAESGLNGRTRVGETAEWDDSNHPDQCSDSCLFTMPSTINSICDVI